MKKIIVLTLCVALSLVFSSSLMAIELSVEAVQAKKVPASYATVKNGAIVYGKHAIAYSPDSMDRIFNAYGVTLSSDANIPKRYATVKDGRIVFGKSSTAYSPDVTHEILTAYGLTLSPEDAANLKDPAHYVKVNNGKLVFGKSSTAYSPEEFNMLMGAYQLPYVPEVTPVPTPIEECLDADKDGVCDDQDDCPGTPRGTDVDARGCPIEIITPEPRVEPVPTPVAPEEQPCTDMDNDRICDDQDDCLGTPSGAYVNERGCWIIENLLFDFDKSVIKPRYYPDLDDVARVLNENPELRVELKGHTCWIGTKKYNQKLSDKRAKAVVEYLRTKGIDPSRLTWRGYGEAEPAFPNTTKEGRIKNRRVEVEPLH